MTPEELDDLIELEKQANVPDGWDNGDRADHELGYRMYLAAPELLRMARQVSRPMASVALAFDLGQQVTKLQQENQRLRTLLRRAEWGEMEGRCSFCGGFAPTESNKGLRYRGHAPDCERAAALASGGGGE